MHILQDHIGSLNWGYRVQLRDKKVDYKNAYAEFVNANTVKVSCIIHFSVNMEKKFFLLPLIISFKSGGEIHLNGQLRQHHHN